ncbi:hypothetical protein DV737_g2484, partial [Chaetothyriales sp. CBS 132003]
MDNSESPSSPERVIQEFKDWKNKLMNKGLSGMHGDDARFLPYDRLQSYLSENKIFELLRAIHKHNGGVHTLRKLAGDIVSKKCIRSFAILVLIDKGDLITQFTNHHDELQDKKLPFKSEKPPAHFPRDPQVYQKFREIQHQFCVKSIKNLDITISADTILPIASMELLDSGVSAEAFKITVHEKYDKINFQQEAIRNRTGSESKHVYALKRFKPSEQASFDREVDAFQRLLHVPNLIGYYGYFTFFIIDNSESMISHRKEVISVLRVLTYLVKEYADDGIHCAFMSDPTFYNKQLQDAGGHQVGISFIQFGNDFKGTKRLQFLDNGMSHKYGVRDVIDHEPFDGNVLKMLLGPTSQWWDVAKHFNQPSTPITARFSSSIGIPAIPDNDSNANPRGFAVRFNLGLDEHNRHSHTDIVTHSTAFFPGRTVQDFLDLLTAIGSGNPGPYLAKHPAAAAFVQDPKPTPVSFATEKFFGVNAIKLIDKDGKATFVRYRIAPAAGEAHLSENEAQDKDPAFLHNEIQTRLIGAGVISFKLLAQIAEQGDVTDDATVHWPNERQIIELGDIKLEKVVEDNDEKQRKIIFDPVPRVKGVEPSDDPLLDMRASIYLISGRERRAVKP